MIRGLLHGWGRILTGHHPNLSIEITRECPLRCPGCYAYGDQHLGGDVVLRQMADLKGTALVDGVLDLIDRYRPVHLSIVGGEPLVRYRELDELLPKIAAKGVYTQIVTSAVRPIPSPWATIPRLQICVSIDGQRAQHDARRKPATYDRILEHIKGHQITVHCTITRQQTAPGYLETFTDFWCAQPDVKRIWFSLYTPQKGEVSDERLRIEDRHRVVASLTALRARQPKLMDMRPDLLAHYLAPPSDPSACVFASTTACVSADLERVIEPCQFGGTPECSECGCMATAGLAAISDRRIGGVPIRAIYRTSSRIGRRARAWRGAAV